MASPWLIVYSWAVYDAHGLEALIKRACAQWHQHGELFGAHYEVLRDVIDTVIVEDRGLLTRHVGADLPPGALEGWLGESLRQLH